MVGENTASARAPAITAHEPLDTSPSLENHAGHRLRHRRPPPVRGREEVLRRQEGTRRDARESKGKRHRDSAVLFRPRRKNPASRLPLMRHAAATDRRPIPNLAFAIRRLSPSSAMCASRRTGPSAPPRTRCVSRRCVRLDVRVPSARQALKRDFSATDDALRERAHADRDRADHTPRASGDDPALHTRRASLTFPVHSYRVRSHRVQQIVCINTAACLFAGRFGLAPTVNKNYGGADSYGKMVEAERPRVQSRDPAGFTIVDVAAWGSLAHIISAGEILGQKAAGFF